LSEERVDLLAAAPAPPRFPEGTRGFGRLGYESLRALCIAVIDDPYLGPALDRRKLSLTRAQEFVSEDARNAVGLENVLDIAYDRLSLELCRRESRPPLCGAAQRIGGSAAAAPRT